MPLDSTATIKDIINALQELEGINQKEDLRSVLISKGIDALDTDSMAELITKLNLANLVLDGKKFAAGVTSASTEYINFSRSNGISDGRYFVEVSGLSFIPSSILIQNLFESTGVSRNITVLFPTAFPGLNEYDRIALSTISTDGSSSFSAIMRLSGNAYSDASGFRLPVLGGVNTQGKDHFWIAIE